VGSSRIIIGAVMASAVGLSGGAASAQQSTELPPVDVTASRLSNGITGASTTIISSDDLERAPQATLQDILSREAGIQTTSLYGGINGAGTTVDMRGFGVTAPSNVLVLVDGRRFNDSDLTGFDFSLIPRNAIERIEITRGNSGAVLYGDGAVGGVINIVTKNGVGAKPSGRIEAAYGALATREGKASASASFGPFSASVFGNAFATNGYRDNNSSKQMQGVGDFRYTTNEGSAFFNISADDLKLRTPGPRNIANGPFVGFFNEYLTNRQGTNTPLDYANRQNVAVRGGVTRNVWDGVEVVLDGSIRRKTTQFATFNPIGGFNPPNQPLAYNDTTLTTYSITPRVNVDRTFGPVRARMVAGIDLYKTQYNSDRSNFQGAAPYHRYDFSQTTTGFYAQPTFTFYDNTDISFGGRIQRNDFHARDTFDPLAPPSPGGVNPAGRPLDTHDTQRAVHLGFEHRFNQSIAVFARMAQSFRVPNIDERVGATPIFTVTNFDLKTQRSRDYEGGVKVKWGRFALQSSVYDMYLTDELHFSPITFANTNLDPTRRYGFENMATLQLTDTVRLKATASYTRAVFRSGPFMGNDVPLVARWSGSAGMSWDLYGKYLVLDAVARFTGKRFLDGDEANAGQMMVPATTLVDLRLGGEIDKFFWSVSVQNLFDRKYFDYGLDQSFPGNQFVSLYPLPGRTFMLRAGMTF